MPMLADSFALMRVFVLEPALLPLIIQVKRQRKTFLSLSHLYTLVLNYHTVRARLENEIHVAEFGVGRGGSSQVLAWLVNRYGGKLSLYDVFGRIPSPTNVDGTLAKERYQAIAHREDQDYYGNIEDLLGVLRSELGEICPLNKIGFYQGRYEHTLSPTGTPDKIDFVHIDCDWYESLKSVYTFLKHSLSTGAVLQVDDFAYWEGARKATEEQGWLKEYYKKLVDGILVIDTSRRI